MPVSVKFAAEVMQQSSIAGKYAANRCPRNTCQIQIRIKRYNRICFIIIFAIVHSFCKLQKLIYCCD